MGIASLHFFDAPRAAKPRGLAKPVAPKIEFVGSIQSDLPCPSLRISNVISDFQKLSLTPDPNQRLIPRHPVPREGALAIVTDVGAGSGGREGCD
jgi:hypothetical protein